MWWLSIKLLSKKSSWRAVVVMRWPEIIYQGVNKSRISDLFNKIPGREKKRTSTIDFNDYCILCGGLHKNAENHHFT